MLHMKPKLMAALVACVMLMLAMGGMAMGEDGSAGEAELIPLSVNGYEMVFQGPLTEGIIWQDIPETEETDIRFCMPVRGEVNLPLFTMTIHQADGDYTVMLQSPYGNTVPVAFAMAQRPAGLTDEEKWEFAWAQADVYILMETLSLIALPEEENPDIPAMPFRLVTDNFELAYDARWDGKIRIYPEGYDNLVFAAVIDGEQYPVFVLRYDADDGNFLIVLKNDDGKVVDVSFDMLTPPEELSGEERMRFYELQGIINEINSTLTLR